MNINWVELILGICIAFLAWLGKRAVNRVDEHDSRIRTLETSRVTHDDIDELRCSLTASIVNVGERAENHMRDMHADNQALLARIECKIDANEERSANTRHKTYDDIHALAMQFAAEIRLRKRDAGD